MTVTTLPEDARVVVVSDLHLGAGGPSDPFGAKDDLFRRFLGEVAARADHFVIAGDAFDIAQAWSFERIERAHPHVVRDLVALSRHMPVHYLAGNHEGSRDALTVGRRIRVEHGHAHDPKNLPGDRAAFWGSRAHAAIEAVIRAPVRIPMRKHHAWSTRLGHWLFYRYGEAQRALAQLDRAAGRHARARERTAFLDYWGRGEWGDPHGLLEAARRELASGDLDAIVFGHSHQAGKVALPGGTYANTGSWTFDDATYARIEHGDVEVLSYPDRARLDDREYRGVLGQHAGKSFFDWWQTYYRGFLRYDVEAMRRHAEGEP